jgi:hypothetical protein
LLGAVFGKARPGCGGRVARPVFSLAETGEFDYATIPSFLANLSKVPTSLVILVDSHYGIIMISRTVKPVF